MNVAGEPANKEDYINIRVEAWDEARKWLRDAVLVPSENWYELCQPKVKITSSGKMQLESKEEMRKRGVKSPNTGDALALTFARSTEGSMPIILVAG